MQDRSNVDSKGKRMRKHPAVLFARKNIIVVDELGDATEFLNPFLVWQNRVLKISFARDASRC